MLARRFARSAAGRTGTATVECAVVLSLVVVPLMIGVWEMGRVVYAQQVVANAAREGARLAAQGRTVTTDGDPIEIRIATGTPNVKDTVFQALVTGGLREITRADIDAPGAFTFTFLAPLLTGSNGGTPNDPFEAAKNQRFRVTVKIPFDRVRWVNLGIVNPTYIQYSVDWQMLVDDRFTIGETLPNW